LAGARDWIVRHQKGDGSFDPVGFLHHEELLGGLKGKTALTAFMAVALREVGETGSSGKAVGFLEGALDAIGDAYTMAITAYALELAKSPRAGTAYQRLMDMAHESDEGLYWGDMEPLPGPPVPLPEPADAAEAPRLIRPGPQLLPQQHKSAAIE